MTPERFQKQLRRRLNNSHISVRRDCMWAVKHGFHKDSVLCWDKAPRSGEPYVFFVCQRNGYPVEPCEAMIDAIDRMSNDRLHGGRPGHAVDVVRGMRDDNDNQDKKLVEAVGERTQRDFTPWVEWATKNHRAYAIKESSALAGRDL